MRHTGTLLFVIILLIFLTSNCAKKGRPSGGKKDSIAPMMVTANPPYKTLNFKENKIKIYFDEFIILKDVNKQFIVSPPLKYTPTIEPQGAASKSITIKFKDTLQANTTYTINFGNSIEDNNENNPLKGFHYIFSTGNYIDSLYTSGSVKDAYESTTSKNINILLYKIDSSYQDSIVYLKKPNYVTNTLDSSLFRLNNLEKGSYKLIAMKDAANNYLFNPKSDKIGFVEQPLSLPRDSVLLKSIVLFKEIPPFRLLSPKEVSKGHLLFPFEGEAEGLSIEPLLAGNSDFKSFSRFETGKDSLNFWFSNYSSDSIQLKITAKKFSDTLTLPLRKKVIDSLKINSNTSRTLELKDTLTLTSNNPIVTLDLTKIKLSTQDSVAVEFTPVLSKDSNKLQFLFEKTPTSSYRLELLPKALTDVFNTHNDSLRYRFSTKETSDYGSIELAVKGSNFPAIIELLTEKGKLVQRYFVSKQTNLSFALLKPGKYKLRAIIDSNNNKRWDTGNYLKKLQPEKIIYSPKIFPIKENFQFSETFILQ
ncbi:hypothetical protein GCM10011416_05140 [Polaribacter pacificus]|uniref:SbsA Ig-like domain-containing protein n=1 Tax=Polaribacter pacificus TaxID=1775173 RepID=A0A917HUN3_9FLAO|nr:Ig-like domain-containing protein [Polaribacter pacificus]GGG91464.1 hypothetical protein GCM10011416_05140 [Polaribacter pacificus]